MAGSGRGRRGFRLRRAALCVTTGVALAALTTACGAAGNPGQAGVAVMDAQAGTITESGSGLLYPLAVTWARAYHQAAPGVTVTTASTGSGKGIQLAAAGTADIGASDAYLSSGDLVQNPTLLNIPLVISAQTVIYNLPGLGQGTHVNLDGTVLAGIYDGTITTWDDPAIARINKGVALPSLKIVPVHRSDSSGDTFLFTSYLSTQDPDWGSKIGYGTTAAWPGVAGALAESGSVSTMNACERHPRLRRLQRDQLPERRAERPPRLRGLANAACDYTLPTAAAIQALQSPASCRSRRPTRRSRSSTAPPPPGTRSSTTSTPWSGPTSPTWPRPARSRPSCSGP